MTTLAPPGFKAVRSAHGVTRFVHVGPRVEACDCGQPFWLHHDQCRECFAASLPDARGLPYEDDRVDDLMAVLERTLASGLPEPPPTYPLCEDCGCALTYELELCPHCVIPWCRANDKTPPRVVYYQPQTKQNEKRRAA